MTGFQDHKDLRPSSFRSFAVAFSIVVPVFYTICEMRNWPLFTFLPATDSVYPGLYAPTQIQGPPMYWYGWIATSFLGSALISFAALWLTPSALRRIPLAFVWIMPVLMVPVLIYALRFFWRW